MGHEEHGGTWHMEAAQLDTQRKKGEAILKTSSTVYSTNRSSSSTRPAKLQLDRAGSDSPHEVMAFAGKDPLRAPISLALEIEVDPPLEVPLGTVRCRIRLNDHKNFGMICGMMVVMECKCGEVGWVRCRWNEMGWCVGRLERTWASVERFCSAI
ncbi:unnamed protein product [Microthlaspi erraticum]|uniref:Uncharacterized protein n=2 Tax=Microthlaspi erraticum TaxID=1685480 RepID=A0A6D2KV11_9BRAS|nr:unnamed protein product [Microthlaspi erraticum]